MAGAEHSFVFVMIRIFTPGEFHEIGALEKTPGLPAFDCVLPAKQCADIHLVCVIENRIHAYCSLWMKSTAPIPDGRAGMIGHYAAAGDAPAEALLQAACATLAQNGCTHAFGPTDGNTWRKYRFVTEPGIEAPFFMEPANPSEYPEQWRRAGFASAASYFSALTEDLTTCDPRLDEAAERLHKNGVRFRAFAMENFEGELTKIYAVATEAFSKNFLYTPLPERAFIEQYAAIRPLVRPEFCTFAEHAGKPIGFLFAIPDVTRAAGDTLIIKTQAVLPGRAYAGAGALLVGEVHAAAAKAGFRRIIHALIHESNNALNMSSRYARVFRRYTLFSKRLLA